jgi:catechol 2,3-dioxygenase-like lactoylglutathione lyase family enzyme
MITALDHIAVVVADLDAALAAYERFLGRRASWKGRYHGGAAHAWLQLPNMALNIIAPAGEGVLGDEVRQRLEASGEGLWAIAFTVDGLDAFRAQAGRRGVASDEPAVLISTALDGARRSWRLCEAEKASSHGVDIVLVERSDDPLPISPPLESESSAVAGLDHVVINTPNPERALALYGARLGLDFRLERSNPAWGSRLMFFRCGGAVVEIGSSLRGEVDPAGPDRLSGLAWRIADPHATQARIAASGFDVSDVRTGRKPGTTVFTVRSGVPGAPTLMLSAEPSADA